MNEKEKAKELVDRFKKIIPRTKPIVMGGKNNFNPIKWAKQYALICVEELWEECPNYKEKYWDNVTKEINKL